MSACPQCGGAWQATTARGFRRCTNWPKCDSIQIDGDSPTFDRARRVKRLIVAGALMRVVLRGDHLALTSWPDDAWLYFTYDTERQALICYVESATFDPVAPGDEIPEWGVTFSQVFPQDFVGDRGLVILAAREKISAISRPVGEKVTA